MTDDLRPNLQEAAKHYPPPADAFERLKGRREHDERRRRTTGLVGGLVIVALLVGFGIGAYQITHSPPSSSRPGQATSSPAELTGPDLVASLGMTAVHGEQCPKGAAFTVPPWLQQDGMGFCLPADLSDEDSVALAMRINGDKNAQPAAHLVFLQHELVLARRAGDEERVASLEAEIKQLTASPSATPSPGPTLGADAADEYGLELLDHFPKGGKCSYFVEVIDEPALGNEYAGYCLDHLNIDSEERFELTNRLRGRVADADQIQGFHEEEAGPQPPSP